MPKSLFWCFTHFPVDGKDFDRKVWVDNVIAKSGEDFEWLRFNGEVSPTTQRYHLQGTIGFKTAVSHLRLDYILPKDHREPTRSLAGALIYCSKEETRVDGPHDFGEIPPIVKRTAKEKKVPAWKLALEAIKAKPYDHKTLVEEHPQAVMFHGRGLKEIGAHYQQEATRKFRQVKVCILLGKTGKGKSKKAFGDFQDRYCVMQPQGGPLWFDGYKGESILLIDEFYGWIAFNLMLRICDGYPLQCQIKGGTVWANWTQVTITSNVQPREWWHRISDERYAAFSRRVTFIENFL